MKSVFLVDDEIAIREGIRERIPWEEEGFRLVGDAPDGEMALPLIEKQVPDILITDIRMPFMDGLQLSRIVRSRLPQVKIIVLSGYDEFDYAREAIRIGVAEYCLKPINARELTRILKLVAERIDAEEAERREKMTLLRKLDETNRQEREKLLEGLLAGSLHPSAALEDAARLGVSIAAPCYRIVGFEAYVPPLESAADRTEEQAMMREAHDLVSALSDGIHAKSSFKRSFYLLKGESEDALSQTSAALQDGLGQVSAKKQRAILFASGSVRRRLQELPLSYSEVEQELDDRRFLHRHAVTELGQIHALLQLDRKSLVDFLKLGDAAQCEGFVVQYLAGMHAAAEGGSRYKEHVLLDTLVTAAQFIRDNGGDPSGLLSRLEEESARLPLLSQAQDLHAVIRPIILDVLSHRDRGKVKNSDLADKAKDYIDTHYADPSLSLHKVASYVNVSPSYFSSVFSQAAGSTFIEYLTKVRIRKAMELLKSTPLRTFEIAERVGYSDPYYFNTLFKKITGCTTKAFRSRNDT